MPFGAKLPPWFTRLFYNDDGQILKNQDEHLLDFENSERTLPASAFDEIAHSITAHNAAPDLPTEEAREAALSNRAYLQTGRDADETKLRTKANKDVSREVIKKEPMYSLKASRGRGPSFDPKFTLESTAAEMRSGEEAQPPGRDATSTVDNRMGDIGAFQRPAEGEGYSSETRRVQQPVNKDAYLALEHTNLAPSTQDQTGVRHQTIYAPSNRAAIVSQKALETLASVHGLSPVFTAGVDHAAGITTTFPMICGFQPTSQSISASMTGSGNQSAVLEIHHQNGEMQDILGDAHGNSSNATSAPHSASMAAPPSFHETATATTAAHLEDARPNKRRKLQPMPALPPLAYKHWNDEQLMARFGLATYAIIKNQAAKEQELMEASIRATVGSKRIYRRSTDKGGKKHSRESN